MTRQLAKPTISDASGVVKEETSITPHVYHLRMRISSAAMYKCCQYKLKLQRPGTFGLSARGVFWEVLSLGPYGNFNINCARSSNVHGVNYTPSDGLSFFLQRRRN